MGSPKQLRKSRVLRQTCLEVEKGGVNVEAQTPLFGQNSCKSAVHRVVPGILTPRSLVRGVSHSVCSYVHILSYISLSTIDRANAAVKSDEDKEEPRLEITSGFSESGWARRWRTTEYLFNTPRLCASVVIFRITFYFIS